jgi:hypothetical protein
VLAQEFDKFIDCAVAVPDCIDDLTHVKKHTTRVPLCGSSPAGVETSGIVMRNTRNYCHAHDTRWSPLRHIRALN